MPFANHFCDSGANVWTFRHEGDILSCSLSTILESRADGYGVRPVELAENKQDPGVAGSCRGGGVQVNLDGCVGFARHCQSGLAKVSRPVWTISRR